MKLMRRTAGYSLLHQSKKWRFTTQSRHARKEISTVSTKV